MRCGSLVGLLLVNEMLRHFLLHHLRNLARFLEMRLSLSIQTDTKIKTERLKKEGQIQILREPVLKLWNLLSHGFSPMRSPAVQFLPVHEAPGQLVLLIS